MPSYVCALPNKKGDGIPQEFISDDPAKIEEWAQQHDKPGWGVFDCHNPLKPGATKRNKETRSRRFMSMSIQRTSTRAWKQSMAFCASC